MSKKEVKELSVEEELHLISKRLGYILHNQEKLLEIMTRPKQDYPPESKMSHPIENLELSAKAYNLLRKYGIRTMEDIKIKGHQHHFCTSPVSKTQEEIIHAYEEYTGEEYKRPIVRGRNTST